MTPSAGSTIRADLNYLVEEAAGAADMPIGLRVLPPMPVLAKSGTYPKLSIAEGELLTAASTVRGPGGTYNRITRKWGTDTFDCVDRGLEEVVDDAESKDFARFGISQEASAARLTLQNVLLDHEVRVAAAVMNTTNFGSGTAAAVAYTAANKATVDFPLDILAAITRVKDKGGKPNTIVMSESVFFRTVQTTILQSFIRGTVTGQTQTPINAANIAAAFRDFGISQVLIGDIRQNTAAKGAAKSLAQVWGNTYIWVGAVNASAGTPKDGGAGFTFYWNAEGGTFVTETYRAEDRRSNVVRVRQNTTEKITDATGGTLITTSYA